MRTQTLVMLGRRSAGLLCLLMVVLSGQLFLNPASAAGPGAPTLTPVHSPVLAGSVPTLHWSAVTGAAKYTVQYGVDPTFGTVTTVTTTNTYYVPTTALKQGMNYWRVQTLSATNQKSAWRSSSFTISATAAPTLVSPADGADLHQPDQPPLLTWQPVTGATSYVVTVASDPNFLNIVSTRSGVTSPSYVVPPEVTGTYYWEVYAVLANGQNTPTASRSYTVEALQNPNLVTPGDSLTNPSAQSVEDVALEWTPVPGAASYELQVATDQSFNNVIDDVKGIVSTRYSPPITYDNQQYYWRVRSYDLTNHPSDWQQVPWGFTRAWQESPSLVAPATSSPPNPPTSVGNPLYFQWTPVPHASSYQLDLGTDPNWSPNSFHTCYTASTTYTPGYEARDQCMPSTGTTYFWRVRAIDAPKQVQGIYSANGSFVYDPTVVALQSPLNGATVPVPTLTWADTANADHYRLVVTSASNQVTTVNTYATSWTPTGSALPPSGSPYTWTVQAVDSSGKVSVVYPGRTFTVGGSLPTTGVPPLTALTGTSNDSATLRAPDLTWEPYPNAAYYTIQYGDGGSSYWYGPNPPDITTQGPHLPYPAVTDTGRWFLNPGTYNWQVTAYSSANAVLGTGPVNTFAIASLGTVAGQKVALTGTGLDHGGCALSLANGTDQVCTNLPSTPVFGWASVPSAGYYMVYIGDHDFTNLIYGSAANQSTIPGTTNTYWAPASPQSIGVQGPDAMPDSQAGQAYKWAIRPCKATNYACAPDPLSSVGNATNAVSKTSPPVVLTSPGTPDPNQQVPNPGQVQSWTQPTVRFDWQDYLTTSQHTPYAPGGSGETGVQAAKQYRIQVATDPFFSHIIDTQTVDQTTYTAFTKTYPEGLLYWRVQAIDDAGNLLTPSPVWVFNKATPAPTLATPGAGKHVAGTTPFAWNPLPFATSYNLQVYKNDDVNMSPSNLVFSTNTNQAAYVWSQPLPVSSSAYLWRVQRVDAGRNVGAWSPLQAFYSSGGVPTQTSPASGGYVRSANPAPFTWSTVAGAVSYLVTRTSPTGSSSTTSTFATAYATTASLAQGRWTWSVQAKDNRGNVLGTSPTEVFRVDSIRPTVTKVLPSGTVTSSANLTLTFSERVTGVNTATVELFQQGRTSTLPATVTYSSAKHQAVLNPKANLIKGKTYKIVATSVIKDQAGNPLRSYSHSFTAK